jgi:hypothetical protein
MKSFLLIAILSIATTNLWAEGAVSALKSILSTTTYHGVNEFGECTVIVNEVNFPSLALNVTINSKNGTSSKLIDDKAVYASRCSNKSFFQSNRTQINDNGDYLDKYIRTYGLEDAHHLLVLIGEFSIVETQYNEKSVECELVY